MSARSVRVLAGASEAFDRGDEELGRRLLATVKGVGGEAEARAETFQGDRALRRADLTVAAQHLRKAVRLMPAYLDARLRLALVYGYTGEGWRAVEHAEYALIRGAYRPQTLVLMAKPNAVLPRPEEFVAISDEQADAMLLLTRVQQARSQRRSAAARRLLSFAAKRNADDRAVLVERADLDIATGQSFADELRSLIHAADHPGYWRLAGLAAEQSGDDALAARCYAASLKIVPDELEAVLGLSRCLPPGQSRTAAAERGRLIQSLHGDLRTISNNVDSTLAYRPAIDGLIKLGRPLEAAAWLELSARRGEEASQVTAFMNRIQTLLGQGPQRILQGPVNDILDGMSEPAEAEVRHLVDNVGRADEPTQGLADATTKVGESSMSFRDDAASAELHFRYSTRGDASETGRRMHEFTGGGVGAADFDGDRRPDLYFAQATENATPWPASDAAISDRLFRNVGGRRFVDVTSQAGVRAVAYGQGVAAGDVDGDGFADVYVGQIGRNQLWLNNGDGTFRNASARLPDSGWTTSVAIADLDGDGAADLYDANYLTGEGVFERVCELDTGQKMACSPVSFPSEPDELLLSDGRGGFKSAGGDVFDPPPGNGLGLIVGRFDDRPRTIPSLDAYVANDMTANLFLAGPTGDASGFSEEGVIRGLAFNDRAVAEAGMGIAAGDPDGDGDVDLFVTNFFEETNTLYEQRREGDFFDATAGRSLERPGFELLGFGTQFLDANGDGRDDLFVANGHVDDQEGKPFAMPPLLLRNRGERFEAVEPSKAGDYFSGEYLGRAVARLDWNEDGRPDVVVTHLDAPAALLTNQSRSVAGLTVRLVAMTTHRDAVGAIVDAKIATAGTPRTSRRFRFAGDGYESTNEPALLFALQPGETVLTLTVHWPGGSVEQFEPPRTQRTAVLIERRGR